MASRLVMLLAACALAGCMGAGDEGHTFADPFEGKGTPVSSSEAVAMARENATRDHGEATLVLVTGAIANRTDGRIAPWDVMFVDPTAGTVYWYVVAGEGALRGANHEYPPPEGFPTRSVEEASVDSVRAVEAARQDPTFARIADELAAGSSGAWLRAQLETWRGGEHDGAPFWSLHAEGEAGAVDVAIDARTGQRI